MSIRRSRRRSDRRQRGSVLVELAMVVLPLVTIVLGMMELGGAWRDKSSAVQASRQGARVVTTSSIALADNADQQALLAVLAGVPAPGTKSGGAELLIRKVVIYDADVVDPYDRAADPGTWDECFGKNAGESDPKQPEVLPSGGSGEHGKDKVCNVYLGGNTIASGTSQNGLELSEIQDDSNWDGSGSAWNDEFKAGDRSNQLGAATRIGVYVEMFRPWITQLLPGDGMIVSGATVMAIEPEGL